MLKIQADRADLLSTVAKVAGAGTSHSSKPILSNMLIRAKDGTATLAATDLSVYCEAELKADIEEEGELTLPIKHFSDVSKVVPGGSVRITQNENLGP